MKTSSVIVLLALAALIAGGVAFLGFWEIPAPATEVEKVIPNDRLPR